jgi:hypothetical protein
MQEHTQKFNLPVVAILSGFAFMIGGFFRTFLEWGLITSEDFLSMFLAIWFGFLMESAIGMAVLAYLLRQHYPFRKLWAGGTSAFALGILFPALVINQFFYVLFFLPGLLVGFFLRLLLNEQSERKSLLSMTALGFLVGQILIFATQGDIPWSGWFYEHFGPMSVTTIMHMVMDASIGFFVAIGVGLMIRRGSQESNV